MVDVGIESSYERFSDTNERRPDIPGRTQKKCQHFFIRWFLPHIEFGAFLSFRRNHPLDLTGHGNGRSGIEFGLVCIRRFTNLYIFLREKLPRFGAGRSPSAVIIPVGFLAHRCLRCSFREYFRFFEARQDEKTYVPKKPLRGWILRIAKGQTSIV